MQIKKKRLKFLGFNLYRLVSFDINFIEVQVI